MIYEFRNEYRYRHCIIFDAREILRFHLSITDSPKKWLKDNVNGSYVVETAMIHFEDKDDAINFKLVWGDMGNEIAH